MENEQKYWFMIEPYVYIHLTENQVILYNTLDYASIESVSYTHLDVYKRQMLHTFF